MKTPLFRISIAALALALTASAPAFAAISAAGGFYTAGGNGQSATGAGLMLSTFDSVPIIPAQVGLTGFLPLATGGGYAFTADGRFAFGGNALGVGAGVGKFGFAQSTGTATVFLDHKIAPLTSLELRGYFPLSSQGATAGFLGVRFSL